MLTVPQEYHTYSAAPERRTDLIVRLDPLSWPTDINAHGTAHSLCMPIQWDKSPPHRLYATGEYNRAPLDGRALVNGWAGQVYGSLQRPVRSGRLVYEGHCQAQLHPQWRCDQRFDHLL